MICFILVMNGTKIIDREQASISKECKKMKNGAKLLEFQDEMINKSLVPSTTLLQISTEDAYGAEALTGSLAPLPTSLHTTGSFFFQLLVSICSTVASLK